MYRKVKQLNNNSRYLDPIFLPLLTNIYRRLSSPTLLRRWLGNYTQHQNESFNSLVWVRAPKHEFHSKARLQLGVIGAVLTFNGGGANWNLVLHALGITTSRNTKNLQPKKDMKRRMHSIEKKENGELHKARKIAEAKQRGAEEDPFYCNPGGF